jgi:hypothetical protein
MAHLGHGDPFQHAPESGLPGTTVELSGRCTPPEGWRYGGAAFGMYDEQGTETIPGNGGIPLQDGSWQGELRIPDGTSAGTYYIWANCYGTPPDGVPDQFHFYQDAEFTVTNP